MKLPKLYTPVMLGFWTHRGKTCQRMGVVFDVDEKVYRKCKRVIFNDGFYGWKWQIVGGSKIQQYDKFAHTDQGGLDEYGGYMDLVSVTL